MSRMRRLFERELLALRRVGAKLPRVLRARVPSGAPPEARKQREGPALRRRRAKLARSAPGTLPERRARGRHRQTLRALAGISASIACHALVLLLLAQWLIRGAAPEEPGSKERWISVRFHVGRLDTPRKPPPEPPPKPVEQPPRPSPVAVQAPKAETPPRPVETPRPRARPSSLSGLTDLGPPSLESRATPAVIGHGRRRPASAGETGSGLFSNRGDGRAEALEAFGGSEGTEDAVYRGLAWLARHQEKDGRWDARGFHRHCTYFTACYGEGQEQFDVGVTGLAALAFLGAGHRPGLESPFEDNVSRAVDYLLDIQDRSGRFGPHTEKYFYNHAIASFAIAEAFGLTGEKRMRLALERALGHSAKAQQLGGGWDYSDPRSGRNDLSITGWQIMAMHTAKAVGVAVPEEMTANVARYLRRATRASGEAVYADREPGAGRRGVAMTAVGLLSRLYVGASPAERSVRRAATRIMKSPPSFEKAYEWDRTYQSSYYWYYGTLALFHLGGKEWDAWNHYLKAAILPRQSREPHEDGSWDPDPNWIGSTGGRVTSTALHVLMLEVYYRYPALHAHKEHE